MADEQDMTFPDLPVGQWWKLRNLFKSNLPKTVNLEYLMSTLKISESTAKNTYRNLGLLGIIDKDGKPNDRANDWRADDLYSQVCKDISEQVFPIELRDIAQASKDKEALVGWFTRKTRIGNKASRKNVGIFEVIFEGNLEKGKETKSAKSGDRAKAQPKPIAKTNKPGMQASAPAANLTKDEGTQEHIKNPPGKPLIPNSPFLPSIHIDIQLHISPDAPVEQINEIFAAIERHLYKQRSGE